jgi:arylsulfatase A-like enzyme
MPRSAALLLLLAACSPDAPGATGPAGAGDREPPANVLLITLDTTRADAIGCLGGRPGITPVLDALAAESVVYPNARTVAPITLPSHASMLTGLYPPRHTVRVNSVQAVPASARTLAEAARERGVETAAFVASIVLASHFGLAQGFDVYDEPPLPPVGVNLPGPVDRRPATEMANAFKGWFWARDPAQPFLAWVHLYDPHAPYDPHNPFRDRDPGDGYLAEVAAADHAVGEILDALRQREVLDDTLVVVVADHGEGRGEHGEPTHSALIYESTMRVPLFVRHHDGNRAGERSDEIVSVVDVFPTAMEALGLPLPAGVDGISLYGSARSPADRGVYMESMYGLYSFEWSALAAWADRDGKYVLSSQPELYDVAADPGETRDLLDGRAGDAAEYREAIEAVLAAPALERSEDDVAAGVTAEHLQGLGYTGAAPTEDVDDPFGGGRPAPQTRMDAWKRFLTTQDMSTVAANARAIETLRDILAENPRNHTAWGLLSTAYLNLRKYAEAETSGRKALELSGGRYAYAVQNNLGLALDAQEKFQEAVPYYERAVELAPGLTGTVQRLVALHEHLGNPEAAQRYRAMLAHR